MSKLYSGKISIAVLLASLLLGAFFLGKNLTSVLAHTPPVDTSCVNCPVVHFSWDTSEVDVAAHTEWADKIQVVDHPAHYDCPTHYSLDGTICHRKDHADVNATFVPETYKDGCPDGYSWNQHSSDPKDCHKDVPATYKTVTHSADVAYEKSSDPTKCHRPSDSDLEHDYGMTHDAKEAFKAANPEWKDSTIKDGYHLEDGQCVKDETPCTDTDADGVCDKDDNCPTVANPGQEDSNDNGVGDACEEQHIDLCLNLPGDQETLPPNMSTNNDHQCSCNQGYHKVEQEVGFTCEQDPTPSVTPAPTPNGDVCLNLEGVQTSIPDGYHKDTPDGACNKFEFGGPPPPPPAGGSVLGASTTSGGKVLGASTMAKTGTFEENLYMAIMGLGAIITISGAKNLKKAHKAA